MVPINLFSKQLKHLQLQLTQLTTSCELWDQKIKQTENRCFKFEQHVFMENSLTLVGFAAQIQSTLNSVDNSILKKLPNELIEHECMLFSTQFNALYKLVQGLEKGKADVLFKTYSNQKERIFQHLQKQYSYENRLLNMISIEEELLLNAPKNKDFHYRERIDALKIRYQKCNTFTQKLEFQLEADIDE